MGAGGPDTGRDPPASNSAMDIPSPPGVTLENVTRYVPGLAPVPKGAPPVVSLKLPSAIVIPEAPIPSLSTGEKEIETPSIGSPSTVIIPVTATVPKGLAGPQPCNTNSAQQDKSKHENLFISVSMLKVKAFAGMTSFAPVRALWQSRTSSAVNRAEVCPNAITECVAATVPNIGRSVPTAAIVSLTIKILRIDRFGNRAS